MSASRSRSPFLYYAIALMSGGVFIYVWILLLARDVNKISNSGTFNLKLLSAWIGFLFLALVGSVAALLARLITAPDHQTKAMSFISNVATLTSILLFITLCVLAAAIHRYLLSKERKKFTMSAIAKIILLTFVMYLSLPYLQTQINDLQSRGEL